MSKHEPCGTDNGNEVEVEDVVREELEASSIGPRGEVKEDEEDDEEGVVIQRGM